MSESPDTARSMLGRGRMDGTKPITDRESKKVMLRGERGDKIQISDVIADFEEGQDFPEEIEIQQRVSTYYGTELVLEGLEKSETSKYLLTAPGPDTFLYLWAAETDADGYRETWSVIAEVKARFTDGVPQYAICNQCGEPIKSLEHEKLAAMDNCVGGT